MEGVGNIMISSKLRKANVWMRRGVMVTMTLGLYVCFALIISQQLLGFYRYCISEFDRVALTNLFRLTTFASCLQMLCSVYSVRRRLFS